MTERSPTQQKLFDELMTVIRSTELSFGTICTSVVQLAKLAETYTSLISGQEKKAMVIASLKYYVMNDSIHDDEQKALLMFINKALPAMIDVIIALDKTSFVIKMKSNGGFWCCSKKK